MSVQSEVSRLQNAKAAIKAAIEGKGVTVPDGTLLDGMSALIESIEAGGGGVTSITGTVTITGSLTKFKLFNYDELTSIFGDPLPTLLILFYSNNSKSGDHTSLILWISDQSYARYCYKAIASGSNAGNTSTVSTTLPTLNKSGLYLNRYSSHYILADEYKYCIARFE